ncbi:MAG: Glu/Leu/Phe/Val dehydrogenase [Alphaproteobacteria bacterium]|nr:Glu/Leu/Phe/Val dehydrogenase [Alphaproteobacteria bacterium]
MQYEDLTDSTLSTFDSYDQHEIVRKISLSSGLTAFIAVHNTNLGPALGGLRMRPYGTERDALQDVLRLSRGMTYKNALAGLPLGGGKAVIIGHASTQKDDDMMAEIGEAVESLDGKYITAEDSGTCEDDMVSIARATEYVVGLPPQHLEGKGFGELGGNPSPLTALGVYRGIQAAVRFKLGRDHLSGLTASVQGVGAVGLETCKLLKQDGVNLIITDINNAQMDMARDVLGQVTVVSPDDIYSAPTDIFVPSAMGGVLNDKTIPQLKAQIIAGAANNQLLQNYHDQMLSDRHILYVPDYLINAGGVICVGYEYFRKSGYNPLDFDMTRTSMMAHVERIGQSVTELLRYAQEKRLHPGEAADRLAEEKFSGRESLISSPPEAPPGLGHMSGGKLVH